MSKSDAIRFDNMWREISDSTGFENGDEFNSEREVREYFTPETQREMFGADAVIDAETLSQYADVVIENRRHCNF